MARTARAVVGGVCYHVINRGNARSQVFFVDDDYRSFVALLDEGTARLSLRLLAYCLMPNHFHLLLWPREDGDLSCFMQWLLTAQVRRHHRKYATSGHLWQGRFKAFPVQRDDHLLTVMRYIERNPLRAGLVGRGEGWPWSSLAASATASVVPSPVPKPTSWVAYVNDAQSDAELEALRRSVNRGSPYGSDAWARRAATKLGLEASLRPRGRPRGRAKK